MKPLIDPIDPTAIEQELADCLLRPSNKGGNLIYVFDGREKPMAMRELGRLRELTFRSAGGGTGLECDIDLYDTMDPPCRQLVVWDPDARMMLGGYRFIVGSDVRLDANGNPRIATSHIFDFSDRFVSDYLPHSIELGRSFVRPEYQSSKAGAKALFALDNLWDGLGALTVVYPQVKYLFGKVTMYPSYIRECRNLILYFMQRHFPDTESLVTPKRALDTGIDCEAMERLFVHDNFRDNYKTLNAEIRKHGISIPPLVNAYMSLSPTMKMFGTAINDEFGDVEETGILIAIDDIFEEKKRRHISTYHPEN
ncbi:MAG: GNAT family N-acetyltransferase [Muribaculaceae bacterium]|nr:GNAT family N-acetyltransferase [Muribaculaceae bacterium]